MTEQEENELICEKLLGWKRCSRHVTEGWQEWQDTSRHYQRTPTFKTWADAGLIMDAFPKEEEFLVGYDHSHQTWYAGPALETVVGEISAETGPDAIRAAALAFIEATEENEG